MCNLLGLMIIQAGNWQSPSVVDSESSQLTSTDITKENRLIGNGKKQTISH